MLVAHEAVHVYHGQVNPSDDLAYLGDIGWFIEGLATYASGQLDARHADRAAEALAAGQGPASLAEAWSGPYRYGGWVESRSSDSALAVGRYSRRFGKGSA